ncbi:hypothetical protein [Novosphingobium gossypii]|uniref:hypothetical protein n=1 Tax=Novosphingobium gossypii TaxID=1604774 RepID=UPI003D243680
MPGRIIKMSEFSYPTVNGLTKFPVDAFNTSLAAMATTLGLTHIFDPAYLVDGVANDLETTGKMTASSVAAITGGDGAFNATIASGSTTLTVTAVTNGNLAVGQPVVAPGLAAGSYIAALGTGTGGTGTYTLSASATASASNVPMTAPAMAQFTVAGNSGIVADFAKTETSFSVLSVIHQTAADLSVAGNKAFVGANQAAFFMLTNGNNFQFSVAGTAGAYTVGAGTFLSLLSYNDATKAVSLHNAQGTGIGSLTASATPANGGLWRIGNLDTVRPFQGRIGNVIIFNKALGLPANADARNALLALARAKYGL